MMVWFTDGQILNIELVQLPLAFCDDVPVCFCGVPGL